MELFMKKILYLLFYLTLNSFYASDNGFYGLPLLTDEDLTELKILNLPPYPFDLPALPYNLGMEQRFNQLNPLREEDFAALGLLDPAAYATSPSHLEGAFSIVISPQDQAARNGLQDLPADTQHSPIDKFGRGESSAPGPMRRLGLRKRVEKKEKSLDFSSEDEKEFVQQAENSDSDYDDRQERASFGRGRTKKNSLQKKFKCPELGCDHKANREWDINTHYRKIHQGELPELCEKCKRYYAADTSDLAKHIKVCGNGNDPKNKARSFCPYPGCGRVYKNETFLQAHIARDHAQPAASTE